MRKTLPKSSILRGYNAFHSVFENGVRFTGKLVNCYVVVEEQIKFQSPVQWGFSVSKKRFQRAVERNRVRRLLRESVRMNSEELVKILTEKNKQAKIVLSFIAGDDLNLKALKMQTVAEEWKMILPQIIQSIP